MKGYNCVTSKLRRLISANGFVGGVEGGKTGEHAVAVGDFEQGADAFGHADDRETALGALAGGEDADDGAKPGGIHVGDVFDVDDDGLGMLAPRDVLELEKSS